MRMTIGRLTGRVDEVMVETRRLEAATKDEMQALLGYLLTTADLYKRDFARAKLNADDALARIQERVRSDEGKQTLAEVEQVKHAFDEIGNAILERQTFTREETIQIAGEQMRMPRQELVRVVEELITFEGKLVQQGRADAHGLAARTRVWTLLSTAAAVLLGAGIALYLTRRSSDRCGRWRPRPGG